MKHADFQVLRTYAVALLESIPEKDYASFAQQLSCVAEALKSSLGGAPLKRVLGQKSLQKDLVAALIQEKTLLESVRNTLQVLACHGRLPLIEELLQVLKHHKCRQEGHPCVKLSTTQPATDKDHTALRHFFGPHALISTQTDPRLGGGYVLEINGFLIDRSARSYFVKLQKNWEEWLDEHQRA